MGGFIFEGKEITLSVLSNGDSLLGGLPDAEDPKEGFVGKGSVVGSSRAIGC